LAKTFETLDTNNDGKISREELLVGFTATMGLVSAELEVERIMQMVDMDANGAIDYTEFIAATVNKNKLLTKERLKQAFDHFDNVNFILLLCLFPYRTTVDSLTSRKLSSCLTKARRSMTRCGRR